MYGTPKKDIYNSTLNSKWTKDIKNFENKKLYPYSDFEDTKSENSFYEKSEPYKNDTKSENSFFYQKSEPYKIDTKSTVSIQDFKGEFEKYDTILEYVKGIDSETKAMYELINKFEEKYQPIDYNKLQQIQVNTSSNTLPNNDNINEKVDILIDINNKLINNISKLSLDLKHIKRELLETTEKLDYVSSHVEYLYDKSFYIKKNNLKIEALTQKEQLMNVDIVANIDDNSNNLTDIKIHDNLEVLPVKINTIDVENISPNLLNESININDNTEEVNKEIINETFELTKENVSDELSKETLDTADELISDKITDESDTVNELSEEYNFIPKEDKKSVFKINNKSTKRTKK